MSDYSGHYCKWTGTSMLSIFQNTCEKVTVHILTDSTLSAQSRDNLVKIARQYDQKIIFYNAANLLKDWWNKYQSLDCWKNFVQGVAAIYRLAAPIILDIPKAIFIDSDIIVDLDIKELWDLDIKGKPIAGVSLSDMGTDSAKRDRIVRHGAISSYKEYINIGTLVIDLEQLRKIDPEYMLKGCYDILQKNLYITDSIEERALSILFFNTCFHLPRKFNYMVGLSRRVKNFKRGVMYHFAGSKMLTLRDGDPYNSLFLSYFIQTPFCNPDTFANLFNECVRVFNESKKSVQDRLNNMQKNLKLLTDNRSTQYSDELFKPAAIRLPSSAEQFALM